MLHYIRELMSFFFKYNVPVIFFFYWFPLDRSVWLFLPLLVLKIDAFFVSENNKTKQMFVLVFITLLSLSIKVNYFVKNCTAVKYNFQTKSETKDRHNKRKSSPFTVTSQWSKHSRCPHNTGSPESDTRRFPPADWAGSKDFTDAWRRKWWPSL